MTDTLYGAQAASLTTSDLYTIDPLSPSTPTSLGALGYALTGLAQDPTTNRVYGATSTNSAASPNSLIEIDILTLAVTVKGAFGKKISDLAFDSSGGLWGFAGDGDGLYSISTSTGAATLVSSDAGVAAGGGCSFDSGDVLYVGLKGMNTTLFLSTVATDTGILTNVAHWSGYSAPSTFLVAAAFAADDVLWGIQQKATVVQAWHLVTIDKATAVITDKGAMPDKFDALAWISDAPIVANGGGPVVSQRFAVAPAWRFVVTDLDHNILTFLDRLGLDRSVTVTRAAPRVITVRVPSDNPEVNIPQAGEPFVDEGTRLLFAFRREGRTGSADGPWKIRAAGVVLDVTDDADSDHATSTVNAYDPWQYLYRRPVLLADGTYPDEQGRSYPAGTRAVDIVLEQFQLAIDNGTPIFADFGQTAFYGGTLESTDTLPDDGDGLAITFERGASLGEMLDTLVATGTCDVVFDPIWDPGNRPGILCDVSILQQAGAFKPNAVFGWDIWPRSVVELSRQTSGNERANRMRMFAGQAGPPVPEEDDPVSIAKYGDYYASQNLVGAPSLAAAHKIGLRQLALQADGLVTYTLSPAAERSPQVFGEFREGDTVPLYASRRFRKSIPGDRIRIESIPIVIGDDQLERVDRMLVSFVPETGS